MPGRAGRGRTGRSSRGTRLRSAARTGAQGRPRRDARSAPPGRSRAARARSAWTGTWLTRSAPTPTTAQRRATARPSGSARRCSPPYLIAWSAARTTPWNGAHHSSWSSGSGRSPGSPIATPGRAGRGAHRAPATQSPQIGGPSAPQPTQWRRERDIERAPGGRPHGRRDARHAGEDGTEPLDADVPGALPRLEAHAPPSRYAIWIRSPTCVADASIVPIGSSSTPCAPRTNGTSPVHVRRARCTLTTGRAPPFVGSTDEDRVDREAHEHHVDPVRVGQPQPGAGRQRRPAHQAHELGPQRVGDLDIRLARSLERVWLRAAVTARGLGAAQVLDDEDDRRARG